MLKETSIKCDNCQTELVTHTSYPATYSLELKTINTNINDSGITYSVHIEPDLKQAVHFCGFGCLMVWCDKNKNQEVKSITYTNS